MAEELELDSLAFQQAWWQDVPLLMAKVEALYAKQVQKGRSSKLLATKKKLIEHRNWVSASAIIDKNFEAVLAQLNYFYVPQGYLPGPMFVMPQRDIEGNFTRAQSRPLYKIVDSQGESSKYRVLGVKKTEFQGPVWLGNDEATLQNIVQTRAVCLIEGGFDLLACRLVSKPGAVPLLCPMTKKIGEDHIAYLRVLGVKQLFLMFDYERGKEDTEQFGSYREGAGQVSMRFLKKDIESRRIGMQVEVVPLTFGDASANLQGAISARNLQKVINSIL